MEVVIRVSRDVNGRASLMTILEYRPVVMSSPSGVGSAGGIAGSISEKSM